MTIAYSSETGLSVETFGSLRVSIIMIVEFLWTLDETPSVLVLLSFHNDRAAGLGQQVFESLSTTISHVFLAPCLIATLFLHKTRRLILEVLRFYD